MTTVTIPAPVGEILKTLEAAGYGAWCVGGCVRDALLDRMPGDWDVTTSARPEETMALFAGRAVPTGLRHGTVTVKTEQGGVEITTLRRDGAYRDHRRPETVTFTDSLEEDLRRRDFTINALALCLNADRLGEIMDPFDGLLDLEDGIIRTPLDPDITFIDDPLRMLRCIRFATQLNFFIEEETFSALEKNCERISIVSAERIITELNKIMMAPAPSKGLVDLHRSGLLNIILPELTALDIVETRNGRSHKNNFYHTLEVVDNVARISDNLWLRWAALLHDIGKPKSKRWEPAVGWTFHNHNFIGSKMIPSLFRRMKLPMDERMKYVKKLVDLHMRPIAIADDIVTDSAVRRLLFDAGNDIDDLMLLCEADITSKNEVRKHNFLNNFKIVRTKLVDIEEKDRIRNFHHPVDGEEIMRIFGLPPCCEIGKLKAALKNAILNGNVPNEHDAALAFVLDKAAEMGLHPQQPVAETPAAETSNTQPHHDTGTDN